MAAILVLTPACAAISGFSDLERVDCVDCGPTEDASPPDGSSVEAAVDAELDTAAPPPDAMADTLDCPAIGRGPAMVKVSGFCVDSTEVTVAQYQAFLTAKGGDTVTQPTGCGWNTSFTPSPWPQTADANNPVIGVDWCDAWAFCAWAGKRLCGKIGGGSNPPAAFADPTSSEWYHACSAGGTRVFPYGNSYDANACEGGDLKPNRLIPTASKSTCVGGFPGIYDMSGNAFEWEDSCVGTAGTGDDCRVRGGSYTNPESYLRCSVDRSFGRGAQEYNIGFRCCN